MRRASLIAGAIATALALFGSLTSDAAPRGSSARLLELTEAGTSPGGAFPPGGAGSVTGTGLVNQIAVFSGAHKLVGFSTLTYDGTTVILGPSTPAKNFFLLSDNANFGLEDATSHSFFEAFLVSDGTPTVRVGQGYHSNFLVNGDLLAINPAGQVLFRSGTLSQFSVGSVGSAWFDCEAAGSVCSFAVTPTFPLTTDSVLIGNAGAATVTAVPSCNTAGNVLQYNATSHALTCVAQAAYVNAYAGPCQTGSTSSSLCAVNDIPWPGGYISARTGASISATATCTCLVAGAGGTTYTLQLLDNGVAAQTATVSCTTAAGTDFSASWSVPTSTTAGHHYTVSKHTTTCTTQPAGCACVLPVTP